MSCLEFQTQVWSYRYSSLPRECSMSSGFLCASFIILCYNKFKNLHNSDLIGDIITLCLYLYNSPDFCSKLMEHVMKKLLSTYVLLGLSSCHTTQLARTLERMQRERERGKNSSSFLAEGRRKEGKCHEDDVDYLLLWLLCMSLQQPQANGPAGNQRVPWYQCKASKTLCSQHFCSFPTAAFDKVAFV